ncbi:S8 family serine peptidase [Laspinema olomoucense]|uniref:S8 family serine peptidase n=1 Tax=Laspinema olomoucense TaxID=3231600 RepID=UPI0021BA66A7|nr:S8 family serine peptidase [Laspinema sp. D3c]MCT7995586.1 S8 family serine peptidase [Laspinema sp. D3c]
MSLDLFDASYYLAANPDLAAVGIATPDRLYRHFQTAGLEEGRPFSPFVNLNYYREQNPELAFAGLTSNSELLKHLEGWGIAEGRSFSPVFDLNFYVNGNTGLASAFAGNLKGAFQHFLTRGFAENRRFSQFIDLDYYLAVNPDLEQALGGDRRAAFYHLVNTGIAEGRRYLPGDLGVITSSHTVGSDPNTRPGVTSVDTQDYYKFRVDTFSDISVKLDGSNASANIHLIRDLNNNGIPDDAEVQEAIAAEKAPVSQLDRFATAPGTYFVKVSEDQGDTAYQLNVSAVPSNRQLQAHPSNTLNEALWIGDVTRPQAHQGFIGTDNFQDFYRFNVNSRSDLRLSLDNLSANLQIQVIQDRNGNGILDNGEIVSTEANNTRNLIDLNGDGKIDFMEYLNSFRPVEEPEPYPATVYLSGLQPGTYFARILQVDNETAYDLMIESIPSGVPASGARNTEPISFAQIGGLPDDFEVADFIGEANPYDFYQFELDKTRNIDIKLRSLEQPADFFLMQDINNDGTFTFQEFITYPGQDPTLTPQINRVLGQGTYFLGVVKVGGNTPYLLTIDKNTPTLPSSGAGNTLATAADGGILSEVQMKSDFLESTNPEDYYKFTLDSFKTVRLSLYELGGNAQLSLIEDINGNGIIDPDEVIVTSQSQGAAQETIERTLSPGTYFARVNTIQGDSTYNLWIEPKAPELSPNGGGNGVADAFNFGLLDRVQRTSGIIGPENPNKFYQFQLDRPRTISLFLDGLSDNADLFLVQDRNFNQAIEPEEMVALSTQKGATLEQIHLTLDPGNYQILVSQVGGPTAYDLSISPQLFNRSSGYGMVNAAAAVAAAIGTEPFPEAPKQVGSNWVPDMVNAPAVWNQGYTGEGVIVAVIDGYLDYTHPQLAGSIWTNSDEINGNGIDDDANGFVDDIIGWNFLDGNNQMNRIDPLEGHASHVAGIISGNNNGIGNSGIAPNSIIMPVAVIGAFTGKEERIASGIRYAVDNGARVINLSLGGGSVNNTLKEALIYAREKGAVIVSASGNDGLNSAGGDQRFSSVRYPAAYASEFGIAVGAVNRDRQIADFTNRAGTDILNYVVAPGEDIYSSVPINTYDFWKGTSMAAPVVSGVAALMLSANPNLTPQQVEQIITGTANPNGIIEDGVFDILG